jgi:type II secretory pathway component PulF
MNDIPQQRSQPAPDGAVAGELVAQTLGGVGEGVPLDEIFLALADDADNRRLRRAAIEMRERVRRGEDLASAFRAIEAELPPFLRRALAGSTDGGQIVAVLEGLVQHETTRQRLRRQMQSALLYPAIVFALLVAILAGAAIFVVPFFEELMKDFALEVPTATRVMLGVSRAIPFIVVAAVAVPVLYVVAGLVPGGRRLTHWLRTGVPFLGRLWIWYGQHEFASVLGSLASRQVALDEALRCTVASLRDQNLARAARIAADKCERGGSLSRSPAQSSERSRRRLRGSHRPARVVPAPRIAAGAVHLRHRDCFLLCQRPDDSRDPNDRRPCLNAPPARSLVPCCKASSLRAWRC